MKKDALIVFLAIIFVIIYYGYFKFKETNTQFNDGKSIPQTNQQFDSIFNNSQTAKPKTDYADEEKFIAEHSNGDYLKIIADAYVIEGLQNSDPDAWQRAENLLNRFLAKNPKDFEALALLIKTKSLLIKPEEAVVLAEQALKNFPEKNSELIFELGKLHEQIGNKEQARAYLNQAIAKFVPSDKQFSEAYFLLARMELQPDQHPDKTEIQEIEKYVSKLIDPIRTNNERAMGYALLAEKYHTENNQSQAIISAKKALKLDPESYAWTHVLGEVMLEGHGHNQDIFYTNFIDEAIIILEKSLQMQKLLSHSYYLLGAAYWHKEKYEKAKEMWRDGLRILPKDPFFPNWFKKTIKKQLEDALTHPEKLFFVK